MNPTEKSIFKTQADKKSIEAITNFNSYWSANDSNEKFTTYPHLHLYDEVNSRW